MQWSRSPSPDGTQSFPAIFILGNVRFVLELPIKRLTIYSAMCIYLTALCFLQRSTVIQFYTIPPCSLTAVVWQEHRPHCGQLKNNKFSLEIVSAQGVKWVFKGLKRLKLMEEHFKVSLLVHFKLHVFLKLCIWLKEARLWGEDERNNENSVVIYSLSCRLFHVSSVEDKRSRLAEGVLKWMVTVTKNYKKHQREHST